LNDRSFFLAAAFRLSPGLAPASEADYLSWAIAAVTR
jgi:hypothetical protein